MKKILCVVGLTLSFAICAEEKKEAKPDEEKINPLDVYETMTVKFQSTSGVKKMEENDWVEKEAPIIYSQEFDEPTKVWHAAGGYLASFDKGEFGGALFYANIGDKKWTKLFDDHVQHLCRFSDNCYMAIGGLAHGQAQKGTVYVFNLDKHGNWKIRKVFESDMGVPILLGEGVTKKYNRKEQQKIFVFSPILLGGRDDMGLPGSLLGVDHKGTIHYIASGGVWDKKIHKLIDHKSKDYFNKE